MSREVMMSEISIIIWAIIAGIVANAIFALIVWIFVKLPSSLSRRDPRRGSRSLIIMFVIWTLVNVALYISVLILGLSILLLIPILISLITIAVIWYLQVNQYWQVGIRGVDKNIEGGINYLSALKLCKNKLEFLGIGANKLTREEEFEKALSRCRPDKPVKLLLLNPEDFRLQMAAQRFDRPINEYKNNVIGSLRRLSDLRNNRKFNIEVRFYSIEPVFRLMFIDDSLCLFSHYELGKGDGSELPQLHITKANIFKPNSDSIYYPLEKYFDELWGKSEQWDFKTHITT